MQSSTVRISKSLRRTLRTCLQETRRGYAAERQPIQEIDFRSDTVTRPTPAMREAMSNAIVGDDVFEDDPTVIQLQNHCASLLGKEAALFTPSGVMANQIALGCHGQHPGTATICGTQSHIYCYETGGASQLWGITLDTIENERNGQLSIEKLRDKIRPLDVHCPITTCIALEQTQNKCGGTTLGDSLEEVEMYMVSVGNLCKQHGLAFHVDGARLLNAAVALGAEPAQLVKECDTVSLCLSKGVGAPVGSVLAGSRALIREAKRLRKLLGGGMRQSGILCAGAMVGLADYKETFTKDHTHAKRLAEALNELSGFHVEKELVQTNLVFCNIEKERVDAGRLKDYLSLSNIVIADDKFGGKHPSNQSVRFALHRGINGDDLEYAIHKIRMAVLEVGPSW